MVTSEKQQTETATQTTKIDEPFSKKKPLNEVDKSNIVQSYEEKPPMLIQEPSLPIEGNTPKPNQINIQPMDYEKYSRPRKIEEIDLSKNDYAPKHFDRNESVASSDIKLNRRQIQKFQKRARDEEGDLITVAAGAMLGASIGSLAGPVGTLVGGLIGGAVSALSRLFGKKRR